MTGRKFVTKRKFVTDPGHLMAARGLGRGVVIGVRVSGDWFKVACVRARADVHVHPARARIPYSRTDRERRRQMDRQLDRHTETQRRPARRSGTKTTTRST